MTTTRTAREVVELYNYVVWNEQNLELAEELFADTVVRHQPGAEKTLTREQAVQRVRDMWSMFDKLWFDLPVVVTGDDAEHVAIVYQTTMTGQDGATSGLASIEVFHVVEGQITEVYNSGYTPGFW